MMMARTNETSKISRTQWTIRSTCSGTLAERLIRLQTYLLFLLVPCFDIIILGCFIILYIFISFLGTNLLT
jgi:hypothetical protein